MPRIVIKHIQGSRAGTREIFPTARFEQLYIGRDPESDIAFARDERAVSRSHALIEWEEPVESTLTISDLLSANGTFVNGAETSGPTPLRSGDRVRLGPGPEFEVEVESGREQRRSTDLPATEQVPHVPEERDLEYEARRARQRRDEKPRD